LWLDLLFAKGSMPIADEAAIGIRYVIITLGRIRANRPPTQVLGLALPHSKQFIPEWILDE